MLKYLLGALALMVGIAGTVALFFFACLHIYGSWHDRWSGWNASHYVSDGWCNVAVVPLAGFMTTDDAGAYTEWDFENLGAISADDVIARIEDAATDPFIDAIVLRIDSAGGVPAAGEAIAEAMKNVKIHNVAFIRGIGTSSAYLAATGADTIFASRFADVGGLGVTMSYLDYSQQHSDQGIEYVELKSAQYKDYGNPDRPLTDEERELLQRDLDVYHDVLVEQVAENRDLPLESIQALADGSSLPADLALASGLVDELGSQEDVRAWLAAKLNLTHESVTFCQPK